MKTEEKAKVVAADWGTGRIQYLAALAILTTLYEEKQECRISAWQNGCIEIFFIIHAVHNHING